MPITPTAIEVAGLTKRFGHGANGVLAVDDLSFTVPPGRITGFLGPNGAGKTTTLRCLVGLVRPTSGEATIGGHSYDRLQHPSSVVGAALEASGFHPGRTARDHLRTRAAAVGLPESSVDTMLDFVGLADARDRKAGQFSLGMRQRLALAMALLPDPSVLILDEPANGLDPAGIAWLRHFLRGLADEGRTILVSSHLLAEVRQTVDNVVIVDQGRLVRAGPLSEVVGAEALVVVATPDPVALGNAVAAAGGVMSEVDGRLTVTGLDAAQVGHAAHGAGVELHGLFEEHAELEQVFLRLTTERPTGDVA
ncbi:MAG: ABC transporter ATP-binding protein [Candidatus Nanopelagicales bacterium]